MSDAELIAYARKETRYPIDDWDDAKGLVEDLADALEAAEQTMAHMTAEYRQERADSLTLTEQLAAAQAVIAEALALYKPTPELGIGRSRWRTADEFLVAIRNALSQSTPDALEAVKHEVWERRVAGRI